ncbi:uncharacterized protein BX664DRAFT_326691 [Halteromyces radiatus]|uniref:uncharacterized protein n=1 Tax=Halteromyces radiatus TaxID=101107 RepID=UPI00221EE611|nr:uncharacterized protein BX664DRAFT_326691 [Halteromyces radiatus]KAI8097561.1 hypothetical protein BX664DRAFT_326691 [Halteromyces radiatus]
MNTPPPESEFPKLEPIPSLSMPVIPPTSPPTNISRPRRHTITRPDITLFNDSDDENEDQALERISGMLSNLIQEANQAVQDTTHSQQFIRPSTYQRQSRLLRSLPRNMTSSSKTISRLPRPTRSSIQFHDRHSSISSSASSVSLFSPDLPVESPTTASSVEQQQQQQHQDFNKDYNSVSPSPSLPLPDTCVEQYDNEQLHHDDSTQQSRNTIQHTRFDDPLMESFRRLDSSMALVDSLSRDLASQNDSSTSSLISFAASSSKFTLLLLPLLHIPHALISMVFDTLTNPGNTNTTSTWKLATSTSSSSLVDAPSSLTSMVAWTFFFTLANMMVTWSGATTSDSQQQQQQQQYNPSSRSRRLSLPGSYSTLLDTIPYPSQSCESYNNRMIRSRRPAPINTTLHNKKASTTRRTPIKRNATSSTRRRYHHSSHASITDKSYTFTIRRSRIQQQQDETEHSMDRFNPRRRTITQQQQQQQQQQHRPTMSRRYSL